MNPEKRPSPDRHYDLAVLGGGIMGLACAFEEALRGKRVAIFDPNPLGRKASWAAAGILSARGGLMGRSAFREFYLRSLYSYPEWLGCVEAESGMTVPYERGGDYVIFSMEDAASIRALEAMESQLVSDKAFNFSVHDELPPFLRAHSPLKRVKTFHFPDDAHLQNRTLLDALEAALRKRGTDLFPESGPLSLSTENGLEIRTAGGNFRTEQALIAAGVWCNDVLKTLGLSLPLSPVKGQLAMLPNFHGQNCMVHCPKRMYLIPRGDHLICGATTERGVWEEGFDSKGDAYLRSQLGVFFPKVEPRWVESWGGLRPRSQDRLPIMGWVDEKAQIAICTGHYKSGISLAPLTARCISALLNGEKPPAKLKPFDPWRKGALETAA